MQSYDFLMLAVVIGCMVFGAWKGMAWQVASLASIVASYFSSVNFCGVLAPMISAEAPWNKAVAMLILYAASSVGIWMLFRLVASFIDSVRLRDFDRQVGALFGAAKGVLLCLVITFFALSLSETARGMVHASRAGYYMTQLLKESDAYLPARVREVLGPYIDQLEDKLNQQGPLPTGPPGPGMPSPLTPGPLTPGPLTPGPLTPGPLTPAPRGPLSPGGAPQPPSRPFPRILGDSAGGNTTAGDWRPNTGQPSGSSGSMPATASGSQPGGIRELGSRLLWEFTGGSAPPPSGAQSNPQPAYGQSYTPATPAASRPGTYPPAPNPPPANDDWNGVFSRGLDVIRTLEEFGTSPGAPQRR